MLYLVVVESKGLPIRGPSFLEQRGYKIYKTAGTSVGALFVTLVIAGYTSQELKELIDNFDINLLLKYESENKGIKKITEIFKKKGLFSIQTFENYLADILARKNIRTFQDVKVGDDYLLKVVVTEMKTAKTVIIPNDLWKYNIDPDTFSVAKAVVMSCNVPLFYQPYKIGKYSFVDGGISANYPLWLFNNEPHPTYGFRLSRLKQEQQEWLKMIYKYGQHFINKVFLSQDTDVKDPRTINIVIKDVTMLEFKKGYQMREKLYFIGYKTTSDYFFQKNMENIRYRLN